jgi:hypothetical protein
MPLSYKTSLESLLASLASLNREVGPTELVCQWFDDFYRPAEKHSEIYDPGVWDRGLQEWKACFTEEELHVLAEFHRLFEAEIDALPDGPDWDKDPKWLAVRDAARLALSQLAGLEPQTKRS